MHASYLHASTSTRFPLFFTSRCRKKNASFRNKTPVSGGKTPAGSRRL